MAMNALKHLTVTAAAPGIVAGGEKKEESLRRKNFFFQNFQTFIIPPNQEIHLQERLKTEETYLFKKEKIDFVFCKYKLLPMKTPNTQQLEKMRNEQMERMKKAEKIKNPKNQEEEDQEGPSILELKTEKSTADIWISED
ncbi:Protein CBG08849 [Caenorhabditis briggsae]|uniref:Protein CBG08849 n=1 Tax=Caenorhabditis briggsae TaxID=6238 RepID=A8X7J2_CAEBR|nr:Protein CBG08849 [Caenorhabditis briggsae]CAP28603.1 Protein CBG08849 [Caenorhabditis briggsae]